MRLSTCVEPRRAAEVVIRKHERGAHAQCVEVAQSTFSALSISTSTRVRAGVDGGVEDPYLLLDAAVESAVVLMAAAGGQNGASG